MVAAGTLPVRTKRSGYRVCHAPEATAQALAELQTKCRLADHLAGRPRAARAHFHSGQSATLPLGGSQHGKLFDRRLWQHPNTTSCWNEFLPHGELLGGAFPVCGWLVPANEESRLPRHIPPVDRQRFHPCEQDSLYLGHYGAHSGGRICRCRASGNCSREIESPYPNRL